MKIFLCLLSVILLSPLSAATQSQSAVLKNVITRTVTAKDVQRIYKIPAIVLATNRAQLSFQLSGRVEKVFIKIGQKVEKGQVLMSLYNPNLDPNIAANLANLEAINARIAQSRRDLANLSVLRKNNSASKTSYQQKQTELSNFKAQRKAIEAQIDLSKAKQQESILKAPFAATVANVTKQTGEFVAPGVAVVSLKQQQNLEVEAHIPRDLWQNLSLGKQLTGFFGTEAIRFKVTELATSSNQISHLYKVVLQIESALSGAIGQQVVIDFSKTYPNVYELPLETIIDDGINQPYLFVINQDEVEKRVISPLFIQNGFIVLRSKKALDLPVVVKGQSQIAVGSKVKISQ